MADHLQFFNMKQPSVQYVDPAVTKSKFASELEKFKALKKHYRELGVFLLEEEYPKLYFGFAAPLLRPVPILFAVSIDFTNYDAEPLSVKFVHPVSFAPQKMNEMPHQFPRKIEGQVPFQPLLIAEMDQEPFICIPGVREYHEHTFHTGDSWFQYRGRNGEGSLCFLLDNLHLYGSHPVKHYTFQLTINSPVMQTLPQQDMISK